MGEENENVEIARFWKWAYSDLLKNQFNLGLFAEFLVVISLTGEDSPRSLQREIDLLYHGKRITVKETKASTEEIDRKASIQFHDLPSCETVDCYIFCLLEMNDHENDPLMTANWRFAVLSKQEMHNRNSISWNTICRILAVGGREVARYPGIRTAVDKAIMALS